METNKRRTDRSSDPASLGRRGLGFTATLFLLPLSAHCGDDTCPEGYTCIAEGGSGGEAVGGEGGAGGPGEGEGGAAPAQCLPIDGERIGVDCGVFVAPGAAGDGSQASPHGSIAEAVVSLGSATRIYVCGGETFQGSIDLPSAVSIYGGLDCGGWTFQSTNPKPEILGDADLPAIVINGFDAGTLSFLRLTAPGATTPGASSIALQANGATTSLEDCDLQAGAGAAGLSGAMQAKAATPAAANGHNAPENGCDGTTSLNIGGDAGLNVCGGTNTDGGYGGTGTNSSSGGVGSAGTPSGGAGGSGEVGGATPMQCTPGDVGIAGADGEPGPGVASSESGSLSPNGYAGPKASSGLSAGGFGRGGGGGGGGNQCNGAGPGGGGGGAGGCGGLPGVGGESGGGSFGLISIGATLSLARITIETGAGGVGGNGGAGQEGMDGGIEGMQGLGGGACQGRPGGKGGRGGAGGGGRGGPSVSLAYVGEAPTETGPILITIAPAAAPGGPGGNGGGANIGGTGAEGIHEQRQAWP